MDNILPFISKPELDARENVRAFVNLCRFELTIFGADLDWNARSWDVTASLKARSKSSKVSMVWTNFDSVLRRENELLSQPFLDFARSYMRYQHGLRPSHSWTRKLFALRALERALSAKGGIADITLVTPQVLDFAKNLIKEKYRDVTAYGVCQKLQEVARFIEDNQMVSVFLGWKNPLPRSKDQTVRVGRKADERRKKLLLNEEDIRALGKAVNIAEEPRDVMAASIGMLLLSAPSRISEVLALPVNCEVEIDGRYGIRWSPSKGGDELVKPIIPCMVDVAKAALEKIRNLTSQARVVAKWYEEHPGELYLPSSVEYMRSASLVKIVDLNQAYGVGINCIQQMLRQDKCSLINTGGTLYARFADIESCLLRRIPKLFPVADEKTSLNYSNALFVIPQNFMSYRSSLIWMPCLVSAGSVNRSFGTSTNHGMGSMFTRLGIRRLDGGDIVMKTHQPRHLLSTIALQGGLGLVDSAKFAGRDDISQTTRYDHETADELLTRIHTATDGEIIGPVAEVADYMPVQRKDFFTLKFPTAHVTDYGFCVHDHALVPCDKFRACLSCTEHICVKGDCVKANRLREQRDMISSLVQKAEEGVELGEYGAGRWYDVQRKELDRMQGILDIYDDPSIPDGTIVQLGNVNEYSAIKAAVDQRKLIDSNESLKLEDGDKSI